jgi:hypothetical protein
MMNTSGISFADHAGSMVIPPHTFYHPTSIYNNTPISTPI